MSSTISIDFMSLSPHIHFKILSYLSLQDIYQGIAPTSKAFYELCKKCVVWRGRYLKVKYSEKTSPGPLLCHSAVVCKDDNGNNQMVCYGGNLSSSNIIENVKKDLWCYQFDTKKWTKSMSQSTSLTEHTSVVYKDTMYTFGGNGGLVDNYSNLVLTYPLPFKPESLIKAHEALPGAPQARSAHTAVVYDNQMYIFGGWNGHESLNDFYSLNLDTLQWRKIVSDNAPSKRRMHSAVVYKDSMYLFGGYDESHSAHSYNELFCFDFQTETWKTVACQGRLPKGRSRAGATVVGNNLYIIGGWDRVTYFGEVLRLDLEKLCWSEEKKDINLKLAQQSCVVIDETWMVMYGGKMNDDSDEDMVTSTDLIVTRLSGLPVRANNEKKKKALVTSLASIQS